VGVLYQNALEPRFGEKTKDWIALPDGFVFIVWPTREVRMWLIGVATVLSIGACFVSGFSSCPRRPRSSSALAILREHEVEARSGSAFGSEALPEGMAVVAGTRAR
jgi:hypothetical protein